MLYMYSRSVRFNNCLLLHTLRTFSYSSLCSTEKYEHTIPHLNIGAHTRVIFQGFTGRQVHTYGLRSCLILKFPPQATQNAKQSLEYGTKIVGGVTPGRDGEHLGLPVLPTVRAVSTLFSRICNAD